MAIMASKKVCLVLILCIASGSIGVTAQMTQQQLLMTFKQQIMNCMGQHICAVSATTTTTSVQCVTKDRICDGMNDCTDMSDEMNCERCAAGEVLCRNTYTCAKPCDGIKQCTTAEDEANCPKKCKHGEMLCQDRTTCAKVCNRINECPTNEDEAGCPPKCAADQVLCQDRLTCARPCDGTVQCTAGGNNEDEMGCPFQCTCMPGQYICEDMSKCLPRADMCEGVGDMAATSCKNAAKMGDDEEVDGSGYKCTE